MFGTTAIPTTAPVPEPVWQWSAPRPPLAQLLSEVRQTNALLTSILAALPNGSAPVAKPDDMSFDPLALMGRVEWLERQVAELKEQR